MVLNLKGSIQVAKIFWCGVGEQLIACECTGWTLASQLTPAIVNWPTCKIGAPKKYFGSRLYNHPFPETNFWVEYPINARKFCQRTFLEYLELAHANFYHGASVVNVYFVNFFAVTKLVISSREFCQIWLQAKY